MAGKKKKKPSANPARGFATVSQPSKVKETVQSDKEDSSHPRNLQAVPMANGPRSVEPQDSGSNTDEAKAIAEMTADELETHLENAELQNIVEQNAPRIKAEATRQASRLNNERRQSRQQADQASVYGLNDALIDSILHKSMQMESKNLRSSKISTSSELEETELLQRLWLLQELLGQLQVEKLDQILTYILRIGRHHGVDVSSNSVWGLKEALTWLAGFGGADESLPYDPDQTTDADNSINIPSSEDVVDSKYITPDIYYSPR